MSGGGGGGNAFSFIPKPSFDTAEMPLNNLPGFPGSYGDKQAGGGAMPPGSGDTTGQRNGLRDKISHDKTLDQVAKNDLLAQLDTGNSDPAAIQQKYADILDPEKQAGKDMLYRKDRFRQADQPGLKSQTSFTDSFLGGGSDRVGSGAGNPFPGISSMFGKGGGGFL